MIVSALDHLKSDGTPDLQAALDVARDGDAVHMPGWLDYVAPAGGFKVKTCIELFGDGPGDPLAGTGTLLKPASVSDPVLVIDGRAGGLPNVRLRDFRIVGPWQSGQGTTNTGHGIQVRSFIDEKVSGLGCERVHVSGVSGSAFSLEGVNGGDGAVVTTRFLDCVAESCGKRGMFLKFVSQALVLHCRLRDNGGAGVRAENSGPALYQCSLDGNDRLSAEGAINFLSCAPARVDACRIVNFGYGAAKGIVFTLCGGAGLVGNCYLEMPTFGGTGIEVSGFAEEGPILILPNRQRRVQVMVKVGVDATGCIVMPQFCDTGAGTIQLPAAPNAGLVAVPNVNRSAGNKVVGVVLPSAVPVPGGTGKPTLSLQAGTLAYNTIANAAIAVRAYVGSTPTERALDLSLARIADLTVDAQGRHSLRLRWTSLGGTEYDLRRSTSPVTESDFSNPAKKVPLALLPSPGVIGSYECFADWNNDGMGLSQCTSYFYAIKYKDTALGWSPMSNGAASMTLCSGFFEVECA